MKKIAKKLLKGIGILFLILLVAFGVLYLIYNEPLPEGTAGAEAEALKEQLYAAVNQSAWEQTRYIAWNFSDFHQFLWDRERNFVEVTWGDTRVLLNASDQTGVIYEDNVLQENDKSTLKKAYSYFINDAFWMNAFVQLEGADLKAVDLENGDKGLLATYSSGGVTPGDSYLWILDENGLPKAWQMWVGIIPIGGIKTTWEDWTTLPTGAKLAQSHKIGPLDVTITDINSFQTLEEGQLKDDPFAPLM